MKKYRTYKILLQSLSMLLLLPLWAGCVQEDFTDCEEVYSLIITGYDAEGNTVSDSEIDDLVLYIFDKDHYFVERIETAFGEKVTVKMPAGHAVNVVAWGNSLHESFTHPSLDTDDHIDSGYLLLSPYTRAGHSIHHSPSDLFHGTKAISVEENKGTSEHELPLYRKTGSMNITVRNLKEFVREDDDDYSVVVRETYNAYDFWGNITGDKIAAYSPEGSFHKQDEFFVPNFILVPDDQITIDIYHGEDLVTSFSRSEDGPIIVGAGVTTNVLIDIATELDVKVTLTPWGETYLWKEFGK